MEARLSAADFLSWGRFPRVFPGGVVAPSWRHEPLPAGASLLPRGCGRSYGDSCLNADGTLIHTAHLDRIVAFDRERGIVRCEAGMTLAQLLEVVVPAGWFPPVLPGTRFVSIGGAIANDVHGKNHHVAGSFGCHVRRFELARSDGTRVECAPDSNAELFAATIGGLGLTGLVTWAEIALVPIVSPLIDVETLAFDGVAEFLALSRDSAERYAHTVAWVDTTARGSRLGRGLFMRGNPAREPRALDPGRTRPRLSIPFDFPAFALSRPAVVAFNVLYYRGTRRGQSRMHFVPFFHPLDAVGGWNRVYGRRGFLQHQGVVPMADAAAVLETMLGEIAASGAASFLSVLKVFGDRPSPGMLSFPRPGATLALDFPHRGEATLALLDRLDAIVMGAGGAIYPAKDARMSPETFARSFPRVDEFERHVDPAFSSSFWRRVRGHG
jgi:FAD/FMN-containing dehydrogenase